MAGSSEATKEILRTLARSVALHRKGGGALDALPEQQRDLIQAMDEAQRRFFLEELAEAGADEGRRRFRAALGRWRARRPPDDGLGPKRPPEHRRSRPRRADESRGGPGLFGAALRRFEAATTGRLAAMAARMRASGPVVLAGSTRLRSRLCPFGAERA